MDGLPECTRRCLAYAVAASNCSSLLDTACLCPNLQLILGVKDCGWQNCTVKNYLRGSRLLYEECDYPVAPVHNILPYDLSFGILIPILAVILRIAGRIIGSSFGLDDVAAVLSLVTLLPISVIGLISFQIGLGHDIWFIPFENITEIMRLFYATQHFYIATIAFSKLATLLLFLRIFPDDIFRRITKVTLVLTTLWWLAYFIALFFRCQPLNYAWNEWDGEHQGQCFNYVRFISVHAIINMALDIIIIALPMPSLIKMNMTWAKKLGICLMFATGIVVTAVSIIRLYSVHTFTIHNFSVQDNPTRTSIVSLLTWSLIEAPLSLTCACMPGTRAFFYYVYNRLWKRGSRTGYSGGNCASSDGRSGTSAAAGRSGTGTRTTTRTFESVSREQGEFILLQEVESGRGK